jgi:hypothetical protein
MPESLQHGDPASREMDGTKPVTDYDSETVMLRAERRDEVYVREWVNRFDKSAYTPNQYTVLERSNRFYGPELLLHSESEDVDFNYLLTAPGPDTYLYLWAAETDDKNHREAWFKAAEVKVAFADTQPTYDLCPECGDPVQTIEHERMAALGRCPGPDPDL